MKSPSDIAFERMETFIAVATRASRQELIEALTRTMVTMFGDRGYFILGAEGTRVVYSTEAPQTGDWFLDPSRYPEVQEALRSGRVISVEDGGVDDVMAPVRHPLPRTPRLVTAVPLVVGDQRLGVVLVKSDEERMFDVALQREALLIASVASILFETRGADRTASSTDASPTADDDTGVPRPVLEGPSVSSAVAAAFVPRRSPELSSSRHAGVPDLSSRPRTVLVVDDDVDQTELLRLALRDEGYLVLTASNGEACLEAVKSSAPDLILLDVNMPGMEGTRVAQFLRQEPIGSAAPIIFVSGCSDLLPRMRNLAISDTDFLQKPYSLEQLLVRMERSFERIETQRRLREEAHLDELTGLGNLRLLRERLATEASRLERYGTPATVVLVDVDKLKAINDQHGHVLGSEALKAIGAVLRSEIRETDLAVRYGGDEFVVLLPHTSLTEGLAFADRVLRQIRAVRPGGLAVTASLGVASRERKVKRTFESLLEHADVAVYRAKHAGGNRVCGYSDTGAENSRLEGVKPSRKVAF